MRDQKKRVRKGYREREEKRKEKKNGKKTRNCVFTKYVRRELFVAVY